MRDLIKTFARSEAGASLVEYAVALIVVTIIGGAGVIALGQNAGTVAGTACETTRTAVAAVNGSAEPCGVGGGAGN